MNYATTPRPANAAPGGVAYGTRRPGALPPKIKVGDQVRTHIWAFPPRGPATSRPAYGKVTAIRTDDDSPFAPVTTYYVRLDNGVQVARMSSRVTLHR